MEPKTRVNAEEGQHDLLITREFDLPVHLLFKAYTDPEIIEQWMTSRVVKLESRKYGSFKLEKTDDKGDVIFHASGVIHEFIPDQKITRTFEMANTSFGVQLEVYVFEKISDDTSKLNMHVIYESIAQRDQVLQLPFTQGINWAHNRLQEIADKLKNTK